MASRMDSSELLEERDEVEMEIEREGEPQININDLDSYLNSIILKSKTKISYCSQAKALIAKQSKAEALIAKQSKAKENLEQKIEELNGQIQSASIENSTLKNQNDQFNKEIQELMENKRQNELLLKRKEDEIEDKNKQIGTLQTSNNRLNNTAKTERNKYDHKVNEYNHLKDKFSKVKNIANSSIYKRLRRDEHYAKKEASYQLDQLDREEEVRYKDYRYNYKEFNAKRMKRREIRQNKHRHLQQGQGGATQQGGASQQGRGAASQAPTSKAASQAPTSKAA